MDAPKLAIPDEVQKDHIFVAGSTGAGKSNTVRSITEHNLSLERRVCTIDVTGDWWGLKSDRTGTKPGFPVTIFGGDHADIQIDPHMGAPIGEFLATTNTPAVIDLQHFSPERITTFLTPFFETVYRLNREVFHMVLDEAHRYIPQQPRPDQAKLIHRVTDMVTGGRSRGFKFMIVSQRPARIHKDPIAMCKTFILHEVTSAHDRSAIGNMMEDAEDAKQVKKILGDLPRMPTGEAWVWVPKRDMLQRIKFPLACTFDSGKAPEEGHRKLEPTKLAKIDVAALQQRLKIDAEKAKEADPAHLRTVIADLRSQLQSARDAVVQQADHDTLEISKTEREAEWQRGYGDGQMAERAVWQTWHTALTAEPLDESVNAILYDFTRKLAPPQMLGPPPPMITTRRIDVAPRQTKMIEAIRAKKIEAVLRDPTSGVNLTGPECKIVTALEDWLSLGFDNPTRIQVAIFAGYHPRTPSFLNSLGSLRTSGIIEHGDGSVRLIAKSTKTGRLTTRDIHGKLFEYMDGPQRKIFEALLTKGAMTREELAEATSYHPRTPSFLNSLGRLNTLEITDSPRAGKIRLNEWVWGRV